MTDGEMIEGEAYTTSNRRRGNNRIERETMEGEAIEEETIKLKEHPTYAFFFWLPLETKTSGACTLRCGWHEPQLETEDL